MRQEIAGVRQRLLLPGALLLFVVATIGVDAYRIGFFADDFHFLDIAGRFSTWDLLSGAHGIWPWFRPISRELYFKVVESFGSQQLAAAHTISLLVYLGVVGLLWRIGTRLLRPSTAATAIGLFSTYDYTKFLVSSASGFQDLFAMFWILAALDAHMAGRRRLAITATFLAPLAKETGFVIVPLVAAYEVFVVGRRRPGAEWIGYGIATALALGLHAVARWSWPATGSMLRSSIVPERLTTVLMEAARAFVSHGPAATPGAWTILRALLGVAALVALSRSTPATQPTLVRSEPALAHRYPIFFVVAAALGALPVVVGHVLRLTLAQGYHLFPAAPWASLLIARGLESLPSPIRRVGVPALIGWNIIGSAFVPLNMDSRESWRLGPVDWRWAIRLAAEDRRLGDDVRRELAVRPESLVVLYDGVPAGAYFQTEDGPATRVLLGDPTVRAFSVNSPPANVSEDRLAILAFNVERLHLRAVDWSPTEILLRAMNAVTAGRGNVAAALLEFRSSSDPARFDRAYARAAAMLLVHGPDRFVESLRLAGLVDTTGSRPTALSATLSGIDPGLAGAMRAMLSSPRSAAAHAALADSMLARNVLPGVGVELRIAATLDSHRYGDRYRLALVMIDLGGAPQALAELDALAAEPSAGALAGRARDLADRVRKAQPPAE